MAMRRRGYRHAWMAPPPVENGTQVTARPAISHYSRELLDETKTVWQPYYTAPLSDEDARQIIENMVEFVKFAARWTKAQVASEELGRKSGRRKRSSLP